MAGPLLLAPYLRVYRRVVDYTEWTAAATTEDKTLWTLPPRSHVYTSYAETTTAHAGLAGTITLQIGYSTGGAELISEHSVAAAIVQGGRETPGGELVNWTTATAVSARLRSGTGNIGTGSATSLSAGRVTIYCVVGVLP